MKIAFSLVPKPDSVSILPDILHPTPPSPLDPGNHKNRFPFPKGYPIFEHRCLTDPVLSNKQSKFCNNKTFCLFTSQHDKKC